MNNSATVSLKDVKEVDNDIKLLIMDLRRMQSQEDQTFGDMRSTIFGRAADTLEGLSK